MFETLNSLFTPLAESTRKQRQRQTTLASFAEIYTRRVQITKDVLNWTVLCLRGNRRGVLHTTRGSIEQSSEEILPQILGQKSRRLFLIPHLSSGEICGSVDSVIIPNTREHQEMKLGADWRIGFALENRGWISR